MRILLIGQTSLHWGRMEFGNIGNYYIIEPFVRELHKAFPSSKISTTLQLSDRFCKDENISILPLDIYYGWGVDNLEIAENELKIAENFNKTGLYIDETPYITEVKRADLVIDFSGDIWGDNAHILGKDRFYVGLIKNRVAQLLNKKTAMLAGSPGPFSDLKIKDFVKEVYHNFDLVTNREKISTKLLEEDGFDIAKTKSLACPAFLFEQRKGLRVDEILQGEITSISSRKKVGFILCGWNFVKGPFDKEKRLDDEFIQFAEAIEYITEVLGLEVFLMSHSNGFPIPPHKFDLIHGRDYSIIKQLYNVIKKRAISSNVVILNGVYDAWTTKTILGNFDMLVSGRIHGAVGGISQYIPTVIIDYGHEPKAHKIHGFAEVVGIKDFVANPATADDLINKIIKCWNNKDKIKKQLESSNEIVRRKARENFIELKKLFL